MPILSQDFIQKAILNGLQNQKCSELHPGQSCNIKMIRQFFATCRSVYKIYLLVHLIPLIIFKRKKLKQRPLTEIRKLLIGFIKSMLFAGGYTLIARRTMCFLAQHHKYNSSNALLASFLGGASLVFQPVARQSEIALFCINKSAQTLYHLGRRRNYPIRIPYGQCLLLGFSIAIICYHYFTCPNSIRQTYLKLLQKMIGNV